MSESIIEILNPDKTHGGNAFVAENIVWTSQHLIEAGCRPADPRYALLGFERVGETDLAHSVTTVKERGFEIRGDFIDGQELTIMGISNGKLVLVRGTASYPGVIRRELKEIDFYPNGEERSDLLKPGMSGSPAFDEHNRVVGIFGALRPNFGGQPNRTGVVPL